MAPFFVRSESSVKKRPADLLRRAFFPCRRGAVSAEQWGRRRGSGEGTRAEGRAQGGGADRRRNSCGERAAGRERVRNAPRREPPRGQTEAERQTEEEKRFPARGGRLRDSGGDGRFSRKRRAFYPFFIPRTGENAVSEGGKIFFARTVQSKVDFFHVA